MSIQAENSLKTELRQGLGLKDAIALVVGTVIGTGVFLKAAVMSQQTGTVAGVFLAWLVAAGLSILGALCYAELGSRFPHAGGEYVFLREGWSPLVSFLYGWTRFWIGSPSAISAYAVGTATFASGFVDVDSLGGRNFLAVVIVWFFTCLNCMKVSFGGSVQIALTILKVSMIALLAAGAIFLSKNGSWSHLHGGGHVFDISTIVTSSFGAAVLAALWAFDGWNNMPMAAGEIRNGQKNVPRALIMGMGIVMLMYVLANLAWFYALPLSEILTSNSNQYPDAMPVATKAASTFLGSQGVVIVSVAFVFSAIGAMNGSILTSARVPFAMAQDGLFPKWFAKVNPKTHVPVRALLTQALTATILAATGTFDQLTDYVVFSSWIWYAMAALAIFKFRKSSQSFEGYKIKWYPLVPLAFFISAVWLMFQAIDSNPMACGIGAAMIFAGVPVFFLNRTVPNTNPSIHH